jgi:hypothetical protein
MPKNNSTQNALRVIYPYFEHGTWAFDDAAVGLTREPFVAGIPEIIESVIGVGRTSFKAVFSDRAFPGATVAMHKLNDEAGGSWYALAGTDKKGWLCPATLNYFDAFPAEIHICFEVLTP